MGQSKVYDFCVYTIRNSEDLKKKLTKGNGSGCFTETKKWATAKKLFSDAKSKSEDMLIVFANAQEIGELIFQAKLKDIQIGKNEAGDVVTTYWFTNLVELQPLY